MKLRLAPLLLVAVLAGCGSSTTAQIPNGSETATATTTAPSAAKAPAGCTPVRQVAPKGEQKLRKPSAKLDPGTTYTATVKTNCGTFSFKLDQKASPNAAASIAYLARKRFFDRTIFHRIVPGFVIQGGDPTASGSGGPGYSTVDKPAKGTSYTKNVVAMAKTGSEPAGTAGSQFFVVTGADASLPADYAVVGKVTSGQDVVQRIGKLGDSSQRPTSTVEILSFRVSPPS
jgi:cyclophilin family peptidyl-prolyl cis-trans isomerase